MEILYGIIAISVIWSLVLFLFFIFKTKKVSKLLIFSLFGTVLLFSLIYGGIMIYEYTETAEFCGETCHPMDPVYISYMENPHNSTMMGVHTEADINCADCHNERGAIGAVESRLDGIRSLSFYLFGLYDMEHLAGEVSKESCVKGTCHDNVDWKLEGLDGATPLHPELDTLETCSECHNPHAEGIDLNKDACTYCHDVNITQIEYHEEYVNEHYLEVAGEIDFNEKCTDCHHMKERIPYLPTVPREFCKHCHDEQNAGFEEFNGKHLSHLGNCASCHETHEELHDCWSTSCHPNDLGPRTLNPFGGSTKKEFLVAYAEETDCTICHPQSYTTKEQNHTLTFDYWPRRGIHQLEHIDNPWCVQCHDPHEAPRNYFPDFVNLEDMHCSEECHVWLSPENDAGRLLENTTTAHGTIYDENGCAAMCHHDPESAGHDVHSYVKSCIDEDCHGPEYTKYLGGEGHSVHSNILSYGYMCYNVCHDESGRYIAPGCYECHNSAHDPVVKIGG